MTKGGEAMVGKKEVRPEDVLLGLLRGEITTVPEGGVVGAQVVYQASTTRLHEARSAGPVVIDEARRVLVDVEVAEGAIIERVSFGVGARRWRFPLSGDPQPKKKATPPAPPRIIGPGDAQRLMDRPFDMHQRYAET
jgi:hypothetical protein